MILVGLGSSTPFLGRPPEAIVQKALGALSRLGRLCAGSRLYRSAAWPNASDPPFINAVAEIASDLGPTMLLSALTSIEAGFGRQQSCRNAPRTLDLDLLDYEGKIWLPTAHNALELPHPRIAARDFVLAPLAEIAPGWRHPVTGDTARALLSRLGRQAAQPI